MVQTASNCAQIRRDQEDRQADKSETGFAAPDD
jgi:hypothetical protein